MNLHHDFKFFEETIRAISQQTGISVVFVEKDYWITLVLSELAKSKYTNQTVFKGGTSLSKGYELINRFSEDIDIAVINEKNKSGNEIKTLIRDVEKKITGELVEKYVAEVTSKGSRFRKSVFEYKSIDSKNTSNKLILEVNSFANPYLFQKHTIKCFVFDFLVKGRNEMYIEQYGLQPFGINVLNKEQTMLEKLVSLIRFSFDANPVQSIASKIRHFYDLYFLSLDMECIAFTQSNQFRILFYDILEHDKEIFDLPTGWKGKTIAESPLVTDFENIWQQLKSIYKSELSALAFAKVPSEKDVSQQFKNLMKKII